MPSHLVLVIDDAGYEAVQDFAVEYGHTLYPSTPNLTSLAASGVRFRRAYTNSVCSATRSQIILGRHAFRTGIGNNCQVVATGPPGAAEAWIADALDDTHTTAVIGKWHLGTQSNGVEFSPLKTASGGVAQFDRHQGTIGNILPGFSNTYWYWARYRDGVQYDLSSNPALIGASDPSNRTATNYATTITVDDALDWIGAQGGDWFCMVAFNAPHEPLHQPPTLAEREAASVYGTGEGARLMTELLENVTTAYLEINELVNVDANKAYLDSVGWPTADATIEAGGRLALHCAAMEAVDTEIGRLISDPLVDDPNVTIWFLSDNGPSTSIGGGKNTQNESGIRTPMIVAGNGVTTTGVCDRLVNSVDIWRTILAMESIDPAVAFPGVALDGVDISPLFADVLATPPRTFAYTERFQTTEGPNPDGGIASIDDGSTNDATRPYVSLWNRSYEDGAYLLIEKNSYDATTHARTTTYELYNILGPDPFGQTDLLLDQNLDFDSVGRNTAHWRGLQRCLAGITGLNP